jgi:hypothetical protein
MKMLQNGRVTCTGRSMKRIQIFKWGIQMTTDFKKIQKIGETFYMQGW